MGMYDTVWVPCPSCQTKYPAQTKSGPCYMDEFEIDSVPEDVAEDVNRHAPFTCQKCGNVFQVGELAPPAPEERPRVDLSKLVASAKKAGDQWKAKIVVCDKQRQQGNIPGNATLDFTWIIQRASRLLYFTLLEGNVENLSVPRGFVGAQSLLYNDRPRPFSLYERDGRSLGQRLTPGLVVLLVLRNADFSSMAVDIQLEAEEL